jgi:hypothetical protein
MTTALDLTFVPLAVRLIDQYGSEAAVKTLASEVFDPTTNTTTEGAETEHTVNIAPPYPALKQLSPESNDVVSRLESWVYPTTGIDYQCASELVFQGDTYRIVEANPIYSGDSIAVIQLILERSNDG